MKYFVSTRETTNGTVWEVWEVCDHQALPVSEEAGRGA